MFTDEEGEQMTPQAGFRLKIAKTGSEAAIVALFNEATGFDVEAEVTEMRRSLPNGTAWISQTPAHVHRIGSPTLARPVSSDKGVWEWCERFIVEGADRERRDCTIEVLDQGGATLATYLLVNGWPRKYVAAELHAGSDNEVPVEKVTIAHDGFKRVANQAEPPAGGE